ncbi:MAG: hypothetical protein SFU56_21080 [Capsulimonadales bacterium]|nr:hypothetical protein [Capsulimonadales bacterium]
MPALPRRPVVQLTTFSVLFLLPLAAQQAPGPFVKSPEAVPPKIKLYNGWYLTPVGQHQTIGDIPQMAALSPDRKTLAVTTGGASEHALLIVDPANGKVRQTLPLTRAQSCGIVWSADGGTLYVAGGNSGRIFVFKVANGEAEAQTPIDVPELAILGSRDTAAPGSTDKERFAAPAFLWGLALSADRSTLYVTNLSNDTLYALNAADGTLKAKRAFDNADRPGTLCLARDGRTLYVGLLGRGTVAALDVATLETRATMEVGPHPNSLLLTGDGSRLFVACGNADAVYAIDTVAGRTAEKISLKLTPKAPAGATPNALAFSPDEKSLYVACSDNNAVAVVDIAAVGHAIVKGFIPTAAYPSVVTALPDGRQLLIGCGKGFGFGPNNLTEGKPIDPVAPRSYPYITALMKGSLTTLTVPDGKQLATYTKQVYANTPYADALTERPSKAPRAGSNPIPSRLGDPSPIKHILYIIKENRTYDQVFGDMTDAKGKRIGNGDPNLTLFGENVTPNHHALAREYILLDNLYCNGEVSVDGHHWSNGAYVPDLMQRTWPAQYGGKGAPPIRYGDFGDPLAETPGGRIWDLCERKGIPYRTYYYHVDKKRNEEWSAARRRGERDYLAADIFIKDVQEWEKTGDMPGFMVMALSEDHTSGTRPGAATPQAAVASNDLGLGKIVEACSKSRFWKEMAIFVIEDDAQNGPDHVDAHRTMGLVISPYTRQSKVDSTHYTTCSMLRTMELILGLPPMSEYDAGATPMYASFRNKADLTPFSARPATIDLNAKNAPRALGAARSMKFDFSAPDRLTRADEDDLNRILWHSIKGENAPYPVPVRRPSFSATGLPNVAIEEDEEEENEENEAGEKRETPEKREKN